MTGEGKPEGHATYVKALDALARRARSTVELERWLADRDHPREHIDEAIARLKSLGYLDDAEYARMFARSRAVGRGMSKRRIQAELTHRGVARPLVDAAIAEVMDEEEIDERAVVEAAAAKKMRTLAAIAPDSQRRRLYAYLARRGYPSDLVRDAVARFTAPK